MSNLGGGLSDDVDMTTDPSPLGEKDVTALDGLDLNDLPSDGVMHGGLEAYAIAGESCNKTAVIVPQFNPRNKASDNEAKEWKTKLGRIGIVVPGDDVFFTTHNNNKVYGLQSWADVTFEQDKKPQELNKLLHHVFTPRLNAFPDLEAVQGRWFMFTKPVQFG